MISRNTQLQQQTKTRQRWLQTIVLESYEGGRIDIPSLEIQLCDTTGSIETATLRPFSVHVATSLGFLDHPARPRPATGVLAQPRAWTFWALLLAGIAVVVAATSAVGTFALRRIDRNAQSLEQWALREIERLDAARLEERWDAQSSVDALANLLQNYLARRFRLKSERLSLSEISDRLDRLAALETATRSRILRLIQVFDQIRFARHEASLVLVRQLFSDARSVVAGRQLPVSEGRSGPTA